MESVNNLFKELYHEYLYDNSQLSTHKSYKKAVVELARFWNLGNLIQEIPKLDEECCNYVFDNGKLITTKISSSITLFTASINETHLSSKNHGSQASIHKIWFSETLLPADNKTLKLYSLIK